MKYEEILELTRKGFNSEQICKLAEMEREEKKQQSIKPDTSTETKEGAEAVKVTEQGTAPRAEPDKKEEDEETKKLRDKVAELEAKLADKAVKESEIKKDDKTADDILMEIMKGE